MAHLSYSGFADVVLTIEGGEVELPGVAVHFAQIHTATFRLGILPDRPERTRCSAVRVTLPDGHVEYGPVTYTTFGLLLFNTGDEWGVQREQPGYEKA